MSGKEGIVEINSTMNISQEDWDKIFKNNKKKSWLYELNSKLEKLWISKYKIENCIAYINSNDIKNVDMINTDFGYIPVKYDENLKPGEVILKESD